jgi:MYXO-CTERM domain-containing protein
VVPNDGAVPCDGAVPSDGNPADARARPDAGRRDFGTPGGGAFNCAVGPQPASTGAWLTLALGLMLAARTRRRR